ncbi:hypothetical protein Tco_0634617 [Tanacetum coccineum]
MCGILLLEIVGNPWEIVNAQWKIREKIFSHKVFTNGIIPWEIRRKEPLSTGFPTDSTVGKSNLCSSGTSTFETSSSKGGTEHAKVNNSKGDKDLPTSSSKDCKEDANATTGTSMDKSGKETGTSEVDAVNVEKDGTGTTYVRKNVDSDEEGEVEHVYDETTTFMASTSSKNEGSKNGSRVGNTSLYENLDVNIKKEKVRTKINIYGSLHL